MLPRPWSQEIAAAPRKLKKWSPASLEVILLALVVVLELQEGGGHWAPFPVTTYTLWTPCSISIFPKEKNLTETLFHSQPEGHVTWLCGHLGTRHCWELPWHSRGWEGWWAWWNPADLGQPAVTVGSKDWTYLTTLRPLLMNVKLK